MNKKEIRAQLRLRHQGQDAKERESRELCSHILQSKEYRSAHVVGCYVAMKHEADITMVMEDVLRSGRALALPKCGRPPHMSFRLIRALDELQIGAFGIPEPKEDAPEILPQQMDLLLVPLEGIDRRGVRLGKGGGYYDCYLSKAAEMMTIGCALSWQWIQELPDESWDRPLKACADHSGIHTFVEYSKVKGYAYGYEEEKASD